MKPVKWEEIKVAQFFLEELNPGMYGKYLKIEDTHAISNSYHIYENSDFDNCALYTSDELDKKQWSWEPPIDWKLGISFILEVKLQCCKISHVYLERKLIGGVLAAILVDPKTTLNIEPYRNYKVEIKYNENKEFAVFVDGEIKLQGVL